MLKFDQYLLKITEEASANASVSGMGPVVTPTPSSIPGQTIGVPSGSGDIGMPLFKPFEKTRISQFSQFKNNRFKRKKKKA